MSNNGEIQKKSLDNSSTQSQEPTYKQQEWYKKLSPEKQEEVNFKMEQREKLKKEIVKLNSEINFKGLTIDIIENGLNRSKNEVLDSEDKSEIQSFEERIDNMNRDIDNMKKIIYKYNLKLNINKLTSSFKKSNEYFKKGLLKPGEKNEQVLQIIENKDLLNISAGEIYTLKQEGYDLSKLFLIGGSEEVSKDNMNIGDTFQVNFGGNKSLNRYIGAGDLLAIDKIDKVKINGVEGERKLSPRPGYYSTSGKYLSIFDNYTIEIVSKKDFTPEEKDASIEAFKNRYAEIRRPELLKKFREQLDKDGGKQIMTLNGVTKNDFGIIISYLNRYLPEVKFKKLKIDLENNSIETRSTETLKMLIDIPTSFGKGYEKYKDLVNEVAIKYGIQPSKLAALINHENGSWDPMAGAPGSSAYGLGQMIDSTWNIYGRGLDRNNPQDQLEATCKYLKKIMGNKNCNMESAMAYYNTGEGIMNVSRDKINNYAILNPAISNKIRGSLTNKSYFIGAVAYYNDISYNEAINKVA